MNQQNALAAIYEGGLYPKVHGPTNLVWLVRLYDLIKNGEKVAPRGFATYELLHQTVTINMQYPVITINQRKLNYAFMAAEAYWILSGDDSVAGISRYNRNISKFSDDGVTFAGAYGPRIQEQMNYVLKTLVKDSTTRQAGLTIWTKNPAESKDIPCTVAIWFQIRNEKLHMSVFMRSSDVWLGLPYDIFNFSMLACYVVAALRSAGSHKDLVPGNLNLTAASSHLYEEHRKQAEDIVFNRDTATSPIAIKVPAELYANTTMTMAYLKDLRDTKPGSVIRWWEDLKL